MNMIEHGIFSNVCNIYIIMVTPQKGAEKSKPILQQNFKKKKGFPLHSQIYPVYTIDMFVPICSILYSHC
jgi:hypothetical protein